MLLTCPKASMSAGWTRTVFSKGGTDVGSMVGISACLGERRSVRTPMMTLSGRLRGSARRGPLRGPLIHERVRPQVAAQVLPLPLVVHRVQPLAVVLPLRLLLGDHEQPPELVPVPVPPGPAQFHQPVVPFRPHGFQDLVLQAQVELPAAGVALPAGPAEELPVDPDRLVPLGPD